VQNRALNPSNLITTADAVAEMILRAPASAVISLAGINREHLRLLLDHADVLPDGRRALFLSLKDSPSAEGFAEQTVDLLADTALQMWPVWWNSASFADIRVDTLGREAARSRVREIARTLPDVSRPWAERAITMALESRRPRVPDVTLATELEQLCLAINRGGVVLVTNPQGSDASAFALVHALEWITRNAHLAVVVLFDSFPHNDPTYDRILYGARCIELENDSAQSAPIGDVSVPTWLAPIQGMPHPLSETERRLAKAISLDAELAPLFGFNLFVQTVRGSRPKVDLLWSEGRLVIELDGFPDHGSRSAFMYDRHRDYELALSGFCVLRLANDEIAQDIGKAIEKIRDMVRLCRARIGVAP
jgi:very-short-patch-repair endonuclease